MPLRAVAGRGRVRLKRAYVRIHGAVQGVGFRYQTRSRAQSLGLTGFVANLPDGSVEAVFEGEPDLVDAMIWFVRDGPGSSDVDRVEVDEEEPEGLGRFKVV